MHDGIPKASNYLLILTICIYSHFRYNSFPFRLYSHAEARQSCPAAVARSTIVATPRRVFRHSPRIHQEIARLEIQSVRRLMRVGLARRVIAVVLLAGIPCYH